MMQTAASQTWGLARTTRRSRAVWARDTVWRPASSDRLSSTTNRTTGARTSMFPTYSQMTLRSAASVGSPSPSSQYANAATATVARSASTSPRPPSRMPKKRPCSSPLARTATALMWADQKVRPVAIPQPA